MPSGVLGPVDFWAFRRLASICFGDLVFFMVWVVLTFLFDIGHECNGCHTHHGRSVHQFQINGHRDDWIVVAAAGVELDGEGVGVIANSANGG